MRNEFVPTVPLASAINEKDLRSLSPAGRKSVASISFLPKLSVLVWIGPSLMFALDILTINVFVNTS